MAGRSIAVCALGLALALAMACAQPEGVTQQQESPATDSSPVAATTPSGQATSTPQGPQRIVTASPGAVAEAEGVRVTLNEIRDPFESHNLFAQPPQGRRFVAFDVTIERTRGGSHYAYCGNFKLQSQDGFVAEYDVSAMAAVGTENLPTLSGANIGRGEKVRGWCAFAVGADARLAVLKYDPSLVTTNDIEFRFQ